MHERSKRTGRQRIDHWMRDMRTTGQPPLAGGYLDLRPVGPYDLDNLLRTIAFLESDWNQSDDGDYVHTPAPCPGGWLRDHGNPFKPAPWPKPGY
jgi:hypothetical protein